MSTDAELIALARHAQGAWHGWMGDQYPEGDKHVSLIARLASALEAARAEEREACARVAENEPEAPGEPPIAIRMEIDADPVAAIRASIACTKRNIASNIRNRTPSPPAEEKKTEPTLKMHAFDRGPHGVCRECGWPDTMACHFQLTASKDDPNV